MSAQPQLGLPPDKPANPAPATSQAMLALLHRHYLPDETRPAGIFAPEIQAPGPTQRRADLIWLGCTAAAGNQLIGHEIKVSRADVLNELADLTKSDPWQRYCDRWYLVIPHTSLVNDLELPNTWGVLTPPSGRRTRSMTIHRQAPQLQPAEQAPALRTLAAWLHWRNRNLVEENHQLKQDNERRWKEVQELRAHDTTRHNPNREVIHRIVTGLGGAWGASGDIGGWEQRVTVDDVITALKDLGAAYSRRDNAQRDLQRVRTELDTAQMVLTRAIQEIDKGGETT